MKIRTTPVWLEYQGDYVVYNLGSGTLSFGTTTDCSDGTVAAAAKLGRRDGVWVKSDTTSHVEVDEDLDFEWGGMVKEGDLVLNVKDYGAVGDGVTDDSAAIQAALDVGGSVLFPTGRTFNLGTTMVVVYPGTNVIAHGATFKFQGTTTGEGAVRFDTPTMSAEHPLTASATEGAFTVTVSTANSANYAAGDHVSILDDTNQDASVTYQAERNVVSSVDGGTGVITLLHPLNFSYTSTSSATTIQKIAATAPTVWEGGSFDLTSATGDVDCLTSHYGADITVRDVTATAWPAKLVQFNSGYRCTVENVRGVDPSDVTAGRGYVCQFAWSRFCEARTLHGESCRHTADITSGSDNLFDGVFTVRGANSVFLHGLRSKRCRAVNVFAEKCTTQGIVAGNATYQGDHDFTVSGFHLNGCEEGVVVTEDCSGFRITDGLIVDSNAKALDTDASVADGLIDVSVDGCAASAAAVDLSGSRIVAKLRVKNSTHQSVLVRGSGDLTLDSPVIEQTAAQPAIITSSFTGRLRITNPLIRANHASNAVSAIVVNTAASLLEITNPTILNLDATALLRGIDISAGSRPVIRGGYIEGADETIRIDNVVDPFIDGVILKPTASTGNGIRLVNTVTTARIGHNRYVQGANEVLNSASAAISFRLPGELEVDGAFNHDGTTFGALGVTPATQQTTVADASVAHALNATFSDTEVEGALDALGAKINSILATLETFGFHASS